MNTPAELFGLTKDEEAGLTALFRNYHGTTLPADMIAYIMQQRNRLTESQLFAALFTAGRVIGAMEK